LDDPLIWARVFHFIATTMAVGVVFFAALVAEPVFAKPGAEHGLVVAFRRRLARIAWVGLGAAVLSGTAWLVLAAEDISDQTLAAVFSNNVIGTVLARTGFGQDWIARLALAGLFAAMLPTMRRGRLDGLHRVGAVIIAAALVGTLAWAGHARGTEGVAGGVHLTADILHLIAAAAWVGARAACALASRRARRSGRKLACGCARRGATILDARHCQRGDDPGNGYC
jgi:copper resistance protein D